MGDRQMTDKQGIGKLVCGEEGGWGRGLRPLSEGRSQSHARGRGRPPPPPRVWTYSHKNLGIKPYLGLDKAEAEDLLEGVVDPEGVRRRRRLRGHPHCGGEGGRTNLFDHLINGSIFQPQTLDGERGSRMVGPSSCREGKKLFHKKKQV